MPIPPWRNNAVMGRATRPNADGETGAVKTAQHIPGWVGTTDRKGPRTAGTARLDYVGLFNQEGGL